MTNFFEKHKKRIRVDENGCWTWLGAKSFNGYGNVRIDKKQYRAHRVSYEDKNGAIPKDKVIDHVCLNKSCVNPNHLEAVSQKINAQRALLGKRNLFCKKGHEMNEKNTYLSGNSRSCKKCKLQYLKYRYLQSKKAFEKLMVLK